MENSTPPVFVWGVFPPHRRNSTPHWGGMNTPTLEFIPPLVIALFVTRGGINSRISVDGAFLSHPILTRSIDFLLWRYLDTIR